MSPSEIADLKFAIETTASFPDSSVVWLPTPEVARRVVGIDYTPATDPVGPGEPRAVLADGKHVTLTRAGIELADFALMTRLATPAAQGA